MVDVDGRGLGNGVRIMLTESWNPELPDAAATLACLNRCFDGGWDETLYQWYLARPFNGLKPDRIIISDEGEPVAGSVINYRQLRAPDGGIRDIGIASGSWTLPEARGQGLFTRMMQASVSRAGENGCQYFLAFVTRDNASRKALERCGAAMVPAVYITSNGVPVAAAAHASIEKVQVSPSEMHNAAATSGPVRFYYASASAWAGQHLERPLPVDVYRLHGEYAIVEKTADTDRLQWTSADRQLRQQVAASLAASAANAGRRFFMYRTDDSDVVGLDSQRGFVCCLPTAAGHRDPLSDLGTDWDIQSADRM